MTDVDRLALPGGYWLKKGDDNNAWEFGQGYGVVAKYLGFRITDAFDSDIKCFVNAMNGVGLPSEKAEGAEEGKR